MTHAQKNNRLVFSTEFGRTCPECEHPIDQCVCQDETLPEGDGVVTVYLDTKGRKGKGVTILSGIQLKKIALKTLAKELKQKCGVGGAVKSNNIEIQGDHRDLIVKLLQQKGYTVKRSGS